MSKSRYAPILKASLTSPRLPFLQTPDIALGIAVKTFLADIAPSDAPHVRQSKLDAFPGNFVPNAINFPEDLQVSLAFFDAIYHGVQYLGAEISAADKHAWKAAKHYRDARQV